MAKKRRNKEKFIFNPIIKRFLSIIGIPTLISLIIFLCFYLPWEVLNSYDTVISEPSGGKLSMATEVQTSTNQEIIEELLNIPPLDYKKICFYNNGSPESFYYSGEYLIIIPLEGKPELIIPYRTEDCISFRGHSYTYLWKFRYDFDLCNESCMTHYVSSSVEERGMESGYAPPKHDNIDFVLRSFPELGNFNNSLKSSDYTHVKIKQNRSIVWIKIFLIWIILIGLFMFAKEVIKFIKKGDK